MNNLNEETNKNLFTVQAEIAEEQITSQPLLPRFAWEDEQAFLKVIIRAKQALDMEELTTILWKTNTYSSY